MPTIQVQTHVTTAKPTKERMPSVCMSGVLLISIKNIVYVQLTIPVAIAEVSAQTPSAIKRINELVLISQQS